MIDTFAIPLAFVIITSLALWIIIGSKGAWFLKAATVVFTTAFSICLWWSLDDLQGWPTENTIPNKFEVNWITVQEPNKKTGDKGKIYVWLKDIEPGTSSHSWYLNLKHKDINEEPRIHKMPYSREMHKKAMEIRTKIAKGGRFLGGKEGKGIGEDGKLPKGDGKGKNGKSAGSLSKSDEDFLIYELPPPSFPQKILE